MAVRTVPGGSQVVSIEIVSAAGVGVVAAGVGVVAAGVGVGRWCPATTEAPMTVATVAAAARIGTVRRRASPRPAPDPLCGNPDRASVLASGREPPLLAADPARHHVPQPRL